MRRTLLVKIAVVVTTLILMFAVLAVSTMMNASEPRAILVYTQKEPIPDIAFKISSIPLALASYFKFGSVRFAVLPATTHNIQAALARAEFLVIGTHGWDGRIYSDEKAYIGPTNNPNLRMRSVYFGSCFFGAKRKDWETMFPNAEVLGHDSETYQMTGWFYLVFKSWIDLLDGKFAEH